MKRIYSLLIFLTTFILSNLVVFAQSITWLGTLGGSESQAWDVSADGSVVVGWSKDNLGRDRAFRWTRTGGIVDLGTIGGAWSWAFGISSEGGVIVGSSHNYQGKIFACVWSNGSITTLDTINTVSNSARRISGDGSVIVGAKYFDISPAHYHAFVWRNSGAAMVDLGTLGGLNSGAGDVSYDGSVVVGASQLSNGDWRAFRWAEGLGMQDLGTIGWQSSANAVSGNGLVVVGDCNQAKAFRWTESGGMQDLGNLGKYDCSAQDVTYNGSIIVGWARRYTDDKVVAFIWTEQSGMKDLNSLYANQIGTGKILNRALAISDDGRYIVGYGYIDSLNRYEGFLLDTESSTGINEIVEIPKEFYLYQNYPNPFNPSTKIRFVIPIPINRERNLEDFSLQASRNYNTLVTLKVYDVLGNEVSTLVNEYKPAGSYEVEFNGNNLASGIYFYQLKADNFLEAKKMMLLK